MIIIIVVIIIIIIFFAAFASYLPEEICWRQKEQFSVYYFFLIVFTHLNMNKKN
jgi:hypothetical protein